MTAEVAILNKQAVALAADSAVTLGRGEKIFASANKIFTLSKYYPVGIMIYGSAEFLRAPWELVIKMYRQQLGKQSFGTLQEYADHFFAFVCNEQRLFPPEVQEDSFVRHFIAYLNTIRNEIVNSVAVVIQEEGEISESRVRQLSSAIIRRHHSVWSSAPVFPRADEDFEAKIREEFQPAVTEVRNTVFQQLSLTRRSKEMLVDIGVWIASRKPLNVEPPTKSGIVIAGYGQDSVYPAILSYNMYGMVQSILNYSVDEQRSAAISPEDHALVISFAQSEMVQAFMEGIDPEYARLLDTDMVEIFSLLPDAIVDGIHKLNEQERAAMKKKFKVLSVELVARYKEKLEQYRRASFVDPVVGVVASLPKDELAAMAESLVNLTSFKRKVSFQAETVGGPIDVAVISKGDGFVWIKRKHYFQPELNPHFFRNYYHEGGEHAREE